MYDITKTRMLLTTAVFAAVAAVLAGGANARALAEDGSGLSAVPAAQAPEVSGTFSVEEICVALDLEQLRGVLVDVPAIKAATPASIQECSSAQADVVSRYLDVNRTTKSQKPVAQPRPKKYPDGRRSSP
jgi:hypothetical protein